MTNILFYFNGHVYYFFMSSSSIRSLDGHIGQSYLNDILQFETINQSFKTAYRPMLKLCGVSAVREKFVRLSDSNLSSMNFLTVWSTLSNTLNRREYWNKHIQILKHIRNRKPHHHRDWSWLQEFESDRHRTQTVPWRLD